MSRVKTIVEGARNILADPARWIKGAQATDASGEIIGSSSSRAVCFCLMGAINRSAYDLFNDQGFMIRLDLAEQALDAVRDSIPIGSGFIPSFNDRRSTTHADVLDVLDRTIARLS